MSISLLFLNLTMIYTIPKLKFLSNKMKMDGLVMWRKDGDNYLVRAVVPSKQLTKLLDSLNISNDSTKETL